jgi:hypothetical protein
MNQYTSHLRIFKIAPGLRKTNLRPNGRCGTFPKNPLTPSPPSSLPTPLIAWDEARHKQGERAIASPNFESCCGFGPQISNRIDLLFSGGEIPPSASRLHGVNGEVIHYKEGLRLLRVTYPTFIPGYIIPTSIFSYLANRILRPALLHLPIALGTKYHPAFSTSVPGPIKTLFQRYSNVHDKRASQISERGTFLNLLDRNHFKDITNYSIN